MRKIIRKLLQVVKPGPSRRNNLVRAGFRPTAWQRSQAELLALFRTPQNRGPIPTWRQSVAQLQAVLA